MPQGWTQENQTFYIPQNLQPAYHFGADVVTWQIPEWLPLQIFAIVMTLIWSYAMKNYVSYIDKIHTHSKIKKTGEKNANRI